MQGTNIETLDHRISDIKSNYVTTNTNQTISGKKTFTSTPTVSGINVSLEGHTHKASEVSGLITTRDIFCVDLLKDRPTNEINLERVVAMANIHLSLKIQLHPERRRC